MVPTRIGITLGDPAGIGPEVAAGALQRWLAGRDRPAVRWTLYGPQGVADVLAAAVRAATGAGAEVAVEVGPAFDGPTGQASAAGGQAALHALGAGIAQAQAGALDALVTAPINKAALALAGSTDLGHTEILRRHLGQGPVGMAFFTPRLQVILATAHMPLRDVFAALTPERIVAVSGLLNAGLQRYHGLSRPRLALAGLNPHAGEGGLMGDEEARLLMPGVHAACAQGLDLSAPQPPDTVFRRALDGEYDGVVALYHDQGLIPVKLLAFGEAVNVTLGLRVPRTSPDHGTAFDRVGTGTARADGMFAALETAHRMATGGQAPVYGASTKATPP